MKNNFKLILGALLIVALTVCVTLYFNEQSQNNSFQMGTPTDGFFPEGMEMPEGMEGMMPPEGMEGMMPPEGMEGMMPPEGMEGMIPPAG